MARQYSIERARNMLEPYRHKASRTRPSTRFVIFAQGRTGSSLLRSLLNVHPEVRTEGEILERPVLDPVRFVERHATVSGPPVFGFKVKIYQLSDIQGVDPRGFLETLTERDYRIIYLHRDNLLRHVISNVFAEQRGQYHDRSGGERPAVEVDPGALIGAMERRQAHRDNEEAVLDGLAHQRIGYEEDLLDPESQSRTATRVFEYLGVEPVEVSTGLARSVSGPLADRIANYDELTNALDGTPYERFLHDEAYEAPGS